MAIAFKKVTFAPLQGLTVAAPDKALIGIVGEDGGGKGALLRLAAGRDNPKSGSVTAGKVRRMIGPADPLQLEGADTLLLHHALATRDRLACEKAELLLGQLRRGGATILMVSNDEPMLLRLCDEVWWLAEGRLVNRGEPRGVLDAYRKQVGDKFRAWGESQPAAIDLLRRRGDGRAQIAGVDLLGHGGRPTMVWRSGEEVEVRVSVRFDQDVANPVIGLLIRNRIGLDVYGTNTELENLMLGPCHAGETVRVSFRFPCMLCPQEYTLTIASHDPNGVRHDWLEEAVAVSVTDSRYTAGVANLRARVTKG